VSLIRLIFSALLAISAASLSGIAHAEETLALNSPMTSEVAPEWLPSARDIRIELILGISGFGESRFGGA